MAPRHTRLRRKVTLATSSTVLLAATVFVGLVNRWVAGTSEQVTQMATLVAILCFLVSVITWVLVVLTWTRESLLVPLLIFGGSCGMCSISYFWYGLSSDPFLSGQRRPSIDRFVLDLGVFGAMTAAFSVLVVASLLAVLYHLWSTYRNRRRSATPSE